MDSEPVRTPRIRRAKPGRFIIEANVADIRWPAKCAVCGGRPNPADHFTLKKTSKGVGEIHVQVAGAPYCAACLPRVHRGRRLAGARALGAWVLGIPLGVLFIVLEYRRQQETEGVWFIWVGLILVLALLIGWGLSWLIVEFPIRALFRRYFARPVEAWLIEEKKADGWEGVSVVVAIPDEGYAAEFARLNGVGEGEHG